MQQPRVAAERYELSGIVLTASRAILKRIEASTVGNADSTLIFLLNRENMTRAPGHEIFFSISVSSVRKIPIVMFTLCEVQRSFDSLHVYDRNKFVNSLQNSNIQCFSMLRIFGI